MERETIAANGQNVEALHRDSQKWISAIHFIQDEMSFIEKLLRSYVFEPTTPNLFERLQDYLSRLGRAKLNLSSLSKCIQSYEYELGGILECHTLPPDIDLERKHEDLKKDMEEYQGKFTMLKSEIFNYAGGILRKRKK